MSLHKGVFYKDSVFVRDKHLLFCQNHAAHSICHSGHRLAVELAYILMAVGAEHAVAILVKAKIERGSVLNHSLVER